MKSSNKGLGRGLGVIFDSEKSAAAQSLSMHEVELSLIKPNPHQPRTLFDEDALEELADSIRTLGVIQPVTLKAEDDGSYTIISGERRCRASLLAGKTTIPAYIRAATDQSLHEMALVENIQREDLGALEVALSLQRLMDECGLTQDALSERVGKKRSTIANYIRLLKLPVEVQAALNSEQISMGHAKAIASLPSEAAQLKLLRRIGKHDLSVRQSEQAARELAEGKQAATPHNEGELEPYEGFTEALERLFSSDFNYRKRPGGGVRITIGFDSPARVEEFIRRMQGGK